MSKIQKSFACLAFISMLWVLASCSSDDSDSSSNQKKPVSSSDSDSPSSSGTATVTLYCTNLQSSVAKGGTITKPKLICSNNVTATNIIWNGLDNNSWEVDPNTYAPDFVISVSATCGSVEKWDVPCGTVTVIAAVSSSSRVAGSSSSGVAGSSSSGVAGSSSSGVAGSSSSGGAGSSSSAVLSCTNLQETVAKGGTIAIPTLTCSNDANPTDTTWTGRPTNNTTWTTNTNSTTTSYTISVTATCGPAGRQSGVRCGTVTVGTGSSSSVGASSSSSSVGANSSSSSVGASSSSSSVGASSSSSSVDASSSSSSEE